MDRRYEWKNLDVTVIDERIINVQDVLKGNDEQLGMISLK